MIRATQGHEKGVGLEIFLKAFSCLPKRKQDQFILYCSRSALEETLESLKLPWAIESECLRLLSGRLQLRETGVVPTQTAAALYAALGDMEGEDILLTLPSSKDQITDKNGGRAYKGHTDWLRGLFPDRDLVMSFVSPRLNVALLTDHTALGDVEKELSPDIFIQRLKTASSKFSQYKNIRRIYVSGANPHCGEDGLISRFDQRLQTALDRVSSQLDTPAMGLYPGDTILFNPINSQTLFVFSFHDQGLAPFKLMNGFTGINLTLGLPFARVSADHGTAFDLYGKNRARYQGMLYLMNEVLGWE